MKIAVYCGSGFGKENIYVEAARNLGKWIALQGHSLVYGGGDSGLMGVVADEVFSAGSEVIGVIPGDVEFIANRPQPYCTEVIKARNMSERKEIMLEKADAFIALPGGIGTLDEISEAITLTKIGVFSKKAVLFNAEGFYDSFKDFCQKMIDSEFLTEQDMEKVLFSADFNEIENFLK